MQSDSDYYARELKREREREREKSKRDVMCVYGCACVRERQSYRVCKIEKVRFCACDCLEAQN